MEDPAHAVNLVVTNFSGGKRHTGRGAIDQGALQEMAILASNMRTGGGFVAAVQEMTSDDRGLPVRAIALEEALDFKALSSFIPRVSTAWYPLEEKWGEKIPSGGAYNEGLCVVTGDAGLVLMPWSVAPWARAGPANVTSATRVLDLPSFIFRDTDEDNSDDYSWLQASVEINGRLDNVSYRPTYYHGNRNSDPRVAQACLLGWRRDDGDGSYDPACVLVNVHLSTLTTELKEGGRGRILNSEAIFLRKMQLDLIAQYVRAVRQETSGLPVVIAGDFNAEPMSPEMIAFADQLGSGGLLRDDMCWKCGTPQEKRPKVTFYSRGGLGWDFTMERPKYAAEPKLSTHAVCSNDACLQPRFTHKGHVQILDNVFVLSALQDSSWDVKVGVPNVDVGWGYSDHAAIIVPLQFVKVGNSSPEMEVGNARIWD